nr:hypothetical protein [Candidatus Saccharibacteria bacterium]
MNPEEQPQQNKTTQEVAAPPVFEVVQAPKDTTYRVLIIVLAVMLVVGGMVAGFFVGFSISFGACFKQSCSPVEE